MTHTVDPRTNPEALALIGSRPATPAEAAALDPALVRKLAYHADPFADLLGEDAAPFDPGPGDPTGTTAAHAQDVLEAYEGREEEIPADECAQCGGTVYDHRERVEWTCGTFQTPAEYEERCTRMAEAE